MGNKNSRPTRDDVVITAFTLEGLFLNLGVLGKIIEVHVDNKYIQYIFLLKKASHKQMLKGVVKDIAKVFKRPKECFKIELEMENVKRVGIVITNKNFIES